MLEREGVGGASASEIVVWYTFVGALMLAPWWLVDVISSGLQFPNMEDLLAILYLSVLSTVVAYIWFVMGVEEIGATAASSYVFLVPPFGVIGGWLLLDEQLGVSLLVGFVLIVLGVRIVQRESETVGRAGRRSLQD